MSEAKKQRRAFILGGGAALGAHQVGALKYLEERGIKPDVLICSSIGVVNGCVYGSGGLVALEEAWKNFYSLPLLRPSLRDNPIRGLSLFSMSRLAQNLEEFMDFPKLLDSRLDIEIIVLNLSRGSGQMWSSHDCRNWEELRDLVRAGYAIPPLFPPVVPSRRVLRRRRLRMEHSARARARVRRDRDLRARADREPAPVQA
jgi:NTE family protein